MENETATATGIIVSTTDIPTAITTVVPTTAPTVATTKTSNGKMKKRGALHMLRVALFMLRRKTNKKSKSVHVDVASKGLWKRLVGSMRPLHLQDNPNSPPSSSPPVPQLMINVCPTIPKNDSFHDVLSIGDQSPMSSPLYVHNCDTPSSSSSASVISEDSMSRYASAQNLQELINKSTSDDDHHNENVTFEIVMGDESGDGDDDDDVGDEMIDARAEEFITQFYEQMRLQQLDLLNRYNEKKKKKKMAMNEN